MYAPIIIFVYNRVDRIQKLIYSLIKCPESCESDLYIFSDGKKTSDSSSKVQSVRDYIDTIESLHAFRSVTITKASKNKGLASSIIDGVTDVIARSGKAIIIEDDNTVSPDFLDYMNRGLDFYMNDSSIWAISGFSRQMHFPDDYKHDIFVMQRISSYTWATWKDRWETVNWDIEDYYPSFFFDLRKRKQFAECGADRPLMLDAQICGRVDSWAIRFEFSMMNNNMFSVLPCISRASCNGNDGSGTHSSVENHLFDTCMSDGTKKVVFEKLQQDEIIRKEFIKPYKNSWKRKLFRNLDFIFIYYLKAISSYH